MITGIEVPLEVALIACAIFAGAGLWTGRVRNARPPDRLGGVPPRSRFAERRNQAKAHGHAVLRARIEPSGNREGWTPELRQQMLDQIADVMRAGLRRDDRLIQTGPDDLFITIRGADTGAALRIARRLRQSLSQLRFPHLPGDARVSARFGVAGARMPHPEHASTIRPAGSQGDARTKSKQTGIVEGCEMEEIIFLPAPTARAADAA